LAVVAVAMAGDESARQGANNDDASCLDDIIEEIVTHLWPFKRKTEAEVTAGVRNAVDALMKIAPLQRKLGDRSLIRDHAKKLDAALGKVEELLASCPGGLAGHLFSPLPPPIWTEGDDLSVKILPEEELKHRLQARWNSLAVELKRLRRICARAIDPGFGLHPNYDQDKHACAWFAFNLMRNLSDHEITGTEDGSFRTITSLLFEALSGHQDADLKRACDDVLREDRGTDPLAK
jgi:hypothetical protein